MADTEGTTSEAKGPGAFRKFAWIRIIVGILIIGVMLWGAGVVLGYFKKPASIQVAGESHNSAESGALASAAEPSGPPPAEDHRATDHGTADSADAAHGEQTTGHDAPVHDDTASTQGKQGSSEHGVAAQGKPASSHGKTVSAGLGAEGAAGHAASGSHGAAGDEQFVEQANGVAFVSAVIEPLRYELSDRFWGWRPNDVITLGDNVINFQLGVLEVTRRAAIQLSDRISRTSSTSKLETELQNAMNWFMVKPNQYWFPSPETKYIDSLDQLEAYRERLISGDASFFARTDNLLPLLAAFVDLLGSCDENLVKTEEKTGEPVSFYKADNYFFYAKGVASAMHPILEAIMVDFQTVLVRRDGTELMHHAIENLDRARHIDPWVITDAASSGILANHRANMAAPISHAMVYLYTLMKTLET